MNEFGKYIAIERVKHPYAWAKGTVHQILSNPIYLGKLVSRGIRRNPLRISGCARPEQDWITVENTHEPKIKLPLILCRSALKLSSLQPGQTAIIFSVD
ncbi:MAG: recombinase family protein [Merdibacter sp.]